MQKITEDFVWAGHLDLDYLAHAFEVNLHTLENGEATYPFQDIAIRHTITVNNEDNRHWTTKVIMAKVSKTLSSDSALPSKAKIGIEIDVPVKTTKPLPTKKTKAPDSSAKKPVTQEEPVKKTPVAEDTPKKSAMTDKTIPGMRATNPQQELHPPK
ncbi:MAG: hypothetical protein ACRCXC_12560 [Legionella sp.]